MLLALVILTGLSSCKKKEGCTDPEAINYSADAKKDDGSCEYETNIPAPTPSTTHTITDNGAGIGTTTWKTGHTYILDGFCFVNSGQTLTIEPGVIVKGKPGTGANASALIVARGGKIYANGTASNPIIMTFEADPLDGTTPITTSGQWGGLIVLGSAKLNSTPGETQIEGIPTSETRGLYGGTNDADDSGVLRYVSIRHGGTDIGAGNEINGLTLGGVGSSTIIEHIEIVGNADDGIEFFGGKPNVKWAVISYCGDDSFDYDEGFRGQGQFWFTVQGTTSDRGGEHDGGTTPEDGTPYAHPLIYNATYIGNGTSRTITFRDNAGGEYHNSIFQDFGNGIDIEDLATGQDSKSRLDAGELILKGLVMSNISANLIVDNNGVDLSGHSSVSDISTTNLNVTASNPVGNYLSAGVTPGVAPTGSFFDAVTYKGAFDPNSSSNWAQGWTKLYGYK
ncbi:MAG: hypothetical protein Kow0079_03910 [Vicingaceae bacterium]